MRRLRIRFARATRPHLYRHRLAAQNATILVASLNCDLNVLAAARLDQCALDALSVIEPVAVLVFRHLDPLGCIEASKAYGVPRDPYAIGVGYICLAADRLPGKNRPRDSPSRRPTALALDRD